MVKDKSVLNSNKVFKVSDITVILCVRVSDDNSWLLERLSFLKKWYKPFPVILVIDYGSSEVYQEKLREVCKSCKYDYFYEDKKGVFSLSESRNIGFVESNTEILFYTDPDFLMERDSFSRLLKIVNSTNFSNNKLTRITMPAYHVIEHESKVFETLGIKAKEELLIQWGFKGMYSGKKVKFDFIAPYSNNFLCHRDLYNLSGGYSTEFKGHGSEDFEFMIRLNYLFGSLPLPKNIQVDQYKPFSNDYFSWKEYSGFRRLAETETFAGEALGLKAFHIWHPRNVESGWYKKNDSKRLKFNNVVSRYIGNEIAFFSEDYLPRDKKALCILSDVSDVGLFVPLRLDGYALYGILGSAFDDEPEVLKKIETGYFDKIYLLRSAIPSIAETHFDVLKQCSVTIVVKGVVNSSIYNQNNFREKLEIEELRVKYKKQKNLNYSDVSFISGSKNAKSITLPEISEKYNTKVYVSLDIYFDFVELNASKTREFVSSLFDHIELNDGCLFIFKSQVFEELKGVANDLKVATDNYLLMESDVNLEEIVSSVDFVFSYNTDEGLVSIASGVPTYVCGDFAYDFDGKFAKKVKSISEAQTHFSSNDIPDIISSTDLRCLANWASEKYSFYYKCSDTWSDKSNTDSEYNRVKFYNYNLGDSFHILGSEKQDIEYSSQSYVASKLGLNGEDPVTKEEKIRQMKLLNDIQGKYSEASKSLVFKDKLINQLERRVTVTKSESMQQLLKRDNDIQRLNRTLEVNLKELKDLKEVSSLRENRINELEAHIAGIVSFPQAVGVSLFALLLRPFSSKKRIDKLKKTPKAFFQDSRVDFTRKVGKLLGFI